MFYTNMGVLTQINKFFVFNKLKKLLKINKKNLF